MNRKKPTKHNLYFQILEVLQPDQCPACILLNDYTDQFIQNILYELINDGQFQKKWVESNGFCQKHTHEMREHGDPLAHSIIYESLLKEQLPKLEEWLNVASKKDKINLLHPFHHSDKKPKDLAISLEGINQCPVCLKIEKSETFILQSIISNFNNFQEFHQTYEEKGVLCVPHFKRLLNLSSEASEVKGIVRVQYNRFQLLKDHLTEIIRKSHYQYSDEPTEKEKGSWIKATKLWVGEF